MICTTVCGTWLVHTCDMTRLYLGCDSFVCATWLVHTWDVTCLSLVCVCVCVCVHATWLVHMWNGTRVCAQYVSLTRVCAQYVSFIYGMRISRTPFVRIHNSIREDTQHPETFQGIHILVCVRNVSHLYIWCGWSISATWLVYMWGVTRSQVGRLRLDETSKQPLAGRCNTLHHTATRCNMLQHAATRCNTLQHT